MKKQVIALFLLVVLLVVTSSVAYATIDKALGNIDNFVRKGAGTIVGMVGAGIAVKNFFRKDVAKAFMYLLFGVVLGVFIGAPDFLMSIANDVLSMVRG